MRRVAILTALVLAVTVIGHANAATRSRQSTAVVLTSDQLARATLALEDLPTGYEALPIPGKTPSAAGGICNGPNESARAQAHGAVGWAYAFFGKSPSAHSAVEETMYSFPTSRRAQEYLTATRTQSQKRCSPYRVASSSGTQIGWIAAVAFKKVGDDELAYRLTVQDSEQGSTLLTADYYTVRVGNNAFTVGQGGSSDEAASQERMFVVKALSKLEAAKNAATSTTTTVVGK